MFKFNELGPIVITVGDTAIETLYPLSYFFHSSSKTFQVGEISCPSVAAGHQVARFINPSRVEAVSQSIADKQAELKALTELAADILLKDCLAWMAAASDAYETVQRANQLAKILNVESVLNNGFDEADITTALNNKMQQGQFEDALHLLMSTRDYCIVYDNYKDNTQNPLGWGAAGKGANLYGKVLMQLRNRQYDNDFVGTRYETPLPPADYYDVVQKQRQEKPYGKKQGQPLKGYCDRFILPPVSTEADNGLLQDLINAYQNRLNEVKDPSSRDYKKAKEDFDWLLTAIQYQTLCQVKTAVSLAQAFPFAELARPVGGIQPLLESTSLTSHSLNTPEVLNVFDADPIEFVTELIDKRIDPKTIVLMHTLHPRYPEPNPTKDFYSVENDLLIRSTLSVSLETKSDLHLKKNTDQVGLYSKGVLVLRDGSQTGYALLSSADQPQFNVISVSPPLHTDKLTTAEYHAALLRVIESQFMLAKINKQQHLVIPVFGSDMGQDPHAVAKSYRQVIDSNFYRQQFQSITFTIPLSETRMDFETYYECLKDSVPTSTYPTYATAKIASNGHLQKYTCSEKVTLESTPDRTWDMTEREAAVLFLGLDADADVHVIYHEDESNPSVKFCFLKYESSEASFKALNEVEQFDMDPSWVSRERATRYAPRLLFKLQDLHDEPHKVYGCAISLKVTKSQYESCIKLLSSRPELRFYLRPIISLMKDQQKLASDLSKEKSKANTLISRPHPEKIQYYTLMIEVCRVFLDKLAVNHSEVDVHKHVAKAASAIIDDSRYAEYLQEERDLNHVFNSLYKFKARGLVLCPDELEQDSATISMGLHKNGNL